MELRRPIPAAVLATLMATLVVAVLAALPAAGQEPVPFRPPTADRPDPGGQVLAVSTVAGDVGPLFDLEAVAQRVGGRLEQRRGDSWSLTLDGREALFGPEIATVAFGTEVLPLTEAPRLVDGRLFVPLDLLQETYGRGAGRTLRWDPATRSLALVRRSQEALSVATDVVHLQGVTTVVLELPRRVRYEVRRRPAGLDVLIPGAPLEATGRRPVEDPLVRGIRIGEDRIALDLVPGAEADSYTLENPFRLVFDVVRGRTEGGGTVVEEPRRPVRDRGPGIRTIVLDPGHGGGETGAVGPSGVMEKELTLLLARALAARLESRLGVRVVLTRDEDAHLPLETRTAIANHHKADLFVSLHLNSAFGPTARGAETYFLSATASDERAARAAEVENAPAVTGGGGEAAGTDPGDDDGDPLFDLQLILWDLAQSHHLEQSQRLANLIQQELNTTLELRDRGVKQAPFLVLMGAAMPAVLVEAGFLSNPEEERRLQDPAYRARVADALVRAIGRYKVEVEATGGGPGTGDDAAAADGAGVGGEGAP